MGSAPFGFSGNIPLLQWGLHREFPFSFSLSFFLVLTACGESVQRPRLLTLHSPIAAPADHVIH
jgi:hypothetical protein